MDIPKRSGQPPDRYMLYVRRLLTNRTLEKADQPVLHGMSSAATQPNESDFHKLAQLTIGFGRGAVHGKRQQSAVQFPRIHSQEDLNRSRN